MFTKADYIEYFRQIASVEEDMIKKCEQDIQTIDDPDIRDQIKIVMQDEIRHYSQIKQILDMVDEKK